MNKLSQTVSFVALSLVLILAGGGGGASAGGGTTPLTGTTGGTQVVAPTTGTPITNSILPVGTSAGYYDFYYLQDAGGTPASTVSSVTWSGATFFNATYYGGVGTTITVGVVAWDNTVTTFGKPYLTQALGGFQADADVTIAQTCPISLGSTNVLVEKTRTATITSATGLATQKFSALYDCFVQPVTVTSTLVVSPVGDLTVSTPTINITVTAADFTSMLSGKWLKVNPTPTTNFYYSFNAYSFVDTGGATHYAIVMRGVPNATGNTTGGFVSLWYK